MYQRILVRFPTIFVITSLLLAGCSPLIQASPVGKAVEAELPSNSEASLANPASVYCQEQGGSLEMREAEDGVVGYCIFPDGSECEEWSFYRNECVPAGEQSLTVEQLWNGRYRSELSTDGVAKLDAGEFHQKTTKEGVTELIIRLVESKFVDLDSDGTEDAIVILVSDPGGSGRFYELAAVLNRSGEPEHVASELLGDRIQIQSVVIQDGKIVIEMITHGPDDPMCCPTQLVRNTYVFENNSISLEFSEIINEN